MRENADRCISYVLISEGEEYTNHPSDPGGPTKWGITLQDVRLHLKKGATAADVKRLTKAQAIWVYKHKYWDALNCDALPSGLDYTIFDYGVNSGIARAGRVLRQALKLPQSDWHVTAAVLRAIAASDTEDLIRYVNKERLAFLKKLRTWRVFGRGWNRRVASVLKISLALHSPVKHGSFFIWNPMVPFFGPGKGMVSNRRAELPTGLMLGLAFFGGLLAIRNRKTDGNTD